jgi:hypothetical protein
MIILLKRQNNSLNSFKTDAKNPLKMSKMWQSLNQNIIRINMNRQLLLLQKITTIREICCIVIHKNISRRKITVSKWMVKASLLKHKEYITIMKRKEIKMYQIALKRNFWIVLNIKNCMISSILLRIRLQIWKRIYKRKRKIK